MSLASLAKLLHSFIIRIEILYKALSLSRWKIVNSYFNALVTSFNLTQSNVYCGCWPCWSICICDTLCNGNNNDVIGQKYYIRVALKLDLQNPDTLSHPYHTILFLIYIYIMHPNKRQVKTVVTIFNLFLSIYHVYVSTIKHIWKENPISLTNIYVSSI